jgi:flagellar protein FlaJ
MAALAEPGEIPRDTRNARTQREVAAVATLGASAILVGGGALLAAAVVGGTLEQVGRLAVAFGLMTLIAAAVLSANMGTLRQLRATKTGGQAYDFMRGQRRLRVASMLLQLLEVFGVIVILILLGNAIGLVRLDLAANLLENGILVLVAALGLSCVAAITQSLRTPITSERTSQANILAGLGLGTAGLLALGAALAVLGQLHFLAPWVTLNPEDLGPIALGGFLALAFATVRLRQLPTLTNLVWQDAGKDRGRALGASRATAVLVPAILAFSLLLVVFLLFLLFGIGVGDIFLSVGRSPLLIAVLAFLLLALLGSLAVAFALSRSAQGDTALYKVLPDAEVRRRRAILYASGLAATLFLCVAALSFARILPHGLWLHMMCLGLLTALGPYGFYSSREHNRIRRLEERFPDFLRDIASSHKGGLTLHQAAAIAARGEYGDLTPEVRKMADQLSWNVSFSEALERFADRVQTPLVQRAVSLILQADRSGGSTTDVLLAAAQDAREIKNLENERRITMGLYTVVVYITFFVFLGVAAILYAQFAPQIVASAQSVHDLSTSGSVVGTGVPGTSGTLQLGQYQLFYFTAAVVQGLGDGIVAGLLGSGKAVLGLRHSFLMVLISYIVFAFLL